MYKETEENFTPTIYAGLVALEKTFMAISLAVRVKLNGLIENAINEPMVVVVELDAGFGKNCTIYVILHQAEDFEPSFGDWVETKKGIVLTGDYEEEI